MILKRAETYLTILSSISIFLIYLTWNNIVPHSQPKLQKFYSEDKWKSDDFKIVSSPDNRGHKWTLGEIRRNPLKQKFQNIPFDDLPNITNINGSINTPDLIGTINRTNQNAQVVIYNRVPKTGSSTVQNLLALQSDIYNFTYYPSDSYWDRVNSVKNEIEMIKFWKSYPASTEALFYDQHIYFIDVETYDKEFEVNWINIVRDPIERFISEFYYNRQEERWKDISERPNQDWFEKDISQCILTNDSECDFGSDYLIEQQLTYFCGSAPECRQIGNEKALKLAKYNAEMYYSVIGVTEHMRISLAIFEEYFPRYFSGLMRLYGRQEFLNQANDKVTLNKKLITKEARYILEEKLSLDIEFYEYLLQRLFNQANKSGILPP